MAWVQSLTLALPFARAGARRDADAITPWKTHIGLYYGHRGGGTRAGWCAEAGGVPGVQTVPPSPPGCFLQAKPPSCPDLFPRRVRLQLGVQVSTSSPNGGDPQHAGGRGPRRLQPRISLASRSTAARSPSPRAVPVLKAASSSSSSRMELRRGAQRALSAGGR